MLTTYIDYSKHWICPICLNDNYFDPDTIDLDQPNELTCDSCRNTINVKL